MKVENKKTIGMLAWRMLKAARLRNAIAVVAIVLTATMFTSIFAIGGNMITSLQDATMRQVGTQSHAGLKYLTQAQYDNFKESPLIKDISYSIVVAGAQNEALLGKQTEIRYAEDDFARWGFEYPSTGRMPQNTNELACSTLTLDALEIPHELGQTVPLQFTVHGKTYDEIFTLCGFWEGDDVMVATQVWLSREYVASVAPVPEVINWDNGMDGVMGFISADIWFANSLNIEENVDALLAERGYSPEEIDVGINWAYMGSSMDVAMIALVTVLLLIMLASGYLIIYSIFTISVTGDIQNYGLLKTIGATGKQLRRIVRRQALALSAVGIPIGLLLGFLLGWRLTPVVTAITNLNSAIAVSVNPIIFIFAALFSLATVFISCRKPGRIAARVSPVEAVRYAEPVAKAGKKRGRRSHKVSPWRMAWANVRRSPKKLIVVLVSLSLSLVLLNSVYSLVQGFDMDEYLKSQMYSDFAVADESLYNFMTLETNYEGVDAAFLEKLKTLDGLENHADIYFREKNHRHESQERMQRMLDEMAARVEDGWPLVAEILEETKKNDGIALHIYGVSPFAMEKVAEKSGIVDDARLYDGDYAFISHMGVGYDHELEPYYAIGERITLTNAQGDTRDFEVIGYVKYPYQLSTMHSHIIDCDVVISDAAYLDFYGETQPMMTIFDVTPETLADNQQWVADYCETENPSMTYRSREFYRAEFTQMQNTYYICGGVLAFILLLIGVLNFINTSFTSIVARRRELAMLQSVGMTGKQLRNMLIAEGGFYAGLSLVLSMTLGSIISATCIRAFASDIWYFKWTFSVLPLVLVSIPLILLCVCVPVLCYRQMRKESLVERLRVE